MCAVCVQMPASVAKHTWHVRGSGKELCEGLSRLAVSKVEVAVFEQHFNYLPGLKQKYDLTRPFETAAEKTKATESMSRA